jgi:hypothetical protein
MVEIIPPFATRFSASKALRKINTEVDQLLNKLEKVLQDPESFVVDSLSIKRPGSIRLDKLSEDIFLDELADRIAYRPIRLLGRVDNSGRPFSNGEDAAVRGEDSPHWWIAVLAERTQFRNSR